MTRSTVPAVCPDGKHTHGTNQMYVVHECSCGPCRAAHRDKHRAFRERGWEPRTENQHTAAYKLPANVRDRIEHHVARTGDTTISRAMAATGYDYETVRTVLHAMTPAPDRKKAAA